MAVFKPSVLAVPLWCLLCASPAEAYRDPVAASPRALPSVVVPQEGLGEGGHRLPEVLDGLWWPSPAAIRDHPWLAPFPELRFQHRTHVGVTKAHTGLFFGFSRRGARFGSWYPCRLWSAAGEDRWVGEVRAHCGGAGCGGNRSMIKEIEDQIGPTDFDELVCKFSASRGRGLLWEITTLAGQPLLRIPLTHNRQVTLKGVRITASSLIGPKSMRKRGRPRTRDVGDVEGDVDGDTAFAGKQKPARRVSEDMTESEEGKKKQLREVNGRRADQDRAEQGVRRRRTAAASARRRDAEAARKADEPEPAQKRKVAQKQKHLPAQNQKRRRAKSDDSGVSGDAGAGSDTSLGASSWSENDVDMAAWAIEAFGMPPLPEFGLEFATSGSRAQAGSPQPFDDALVGVDDMVRDEKAFMDAWGLGYPGSGRPQKPPPELRFPPVAVVKM